MPKRCPLLPTEPAKVPVCCEELGMQCCLKMDEGCAIVVIAQTLIQIRDKMHGPPH